MTARGGDGRRLNYTEAAAGLFLAVVAFAALRNAQAGTLRQWLASKFLNRGEGTPGSTAPPTAGGGISSPPTPAAGGGGQFADPVPGGTTLSVWGDPRDGGARRHQGIDIGAPRGTPVLAAASGTVKYSTYSGRCGLGVSIDHGGGWRTVYCHLASSDVARGDTVTRGQRIGTVGNTGNAQTTPPHLHFEIRHNDAPVNPQALIGR